MILTTWRCSPAKSFVLNEGRLWSCLCTTRFYTYTDATRIALAHTRSFSYSVCPPFVILSEANHVRRRGCSLISIHAENRSGGDVDSCPRVLWKYCPIRVWGRKNRNICEFDLLPNFVEPRRFAFFRMKSPSKRFLWFGRCMVNVNIRVVRGLRSDGCVIRRETKFVCGSKTVKL